MKILLLVPPIVYKRQPSIGVAYLCAVLREQGYEVMVRDLNVDVQGINDGDDGFWSREENVDAFIASHQTLFDGWLADIERYDPDIVGFNVWSTSRKQSVYLADRIKNHDPECLVVFGGPEAVLGDNLLVGAGSVDIVVRGEGEQTFLEIVREFERQGKVEFCPGASVRNGGKLIDCGKREEIRDLDSLPFPDFSDFRQDAYLFQGHMPISFGRGCRWRCSFCTLENCWKAYRGRSAGNIVQEMKERLKDGSVHQFVVCDPAVNQDVGQVSALCDLMLREGVEAKWDGMAQIHPGMDLDFLRKMKQAGCALLNYGVESGSQNVLNSMGKRYLVADALRVIRDTHDAGIDVVLNFVVGHPGETEEDFQETIDFIASVKDHVLNIAPGHPCLVLPYNRLYRYPGKYGIRYDRQDSYQWESLDGSNTAAVREQRVKRFNDFLQQLNIEMSCGEDDREKMEKEI